MRNRKGLESVEVWMWIIAGLVIGGLIFGGGYALFSRWVRNNEVNQAQTSFSLLRTTVANVCTMGMEREEIVRYVFPKLVKNISIKAEDRSRQRGTQLCINIEEEGEFCDDLGIEPFSCKLTLNMDTLDFESGTKGIFSIIKRASKNKEVNNVEFIVAARDKTDVCISWKEKFEESSLGSGIRFAGVGEECSIKCDCMEGLDCGAGHCCPEGEYYDGTQCISYAENGICDPQVGEDCTNNPDCAQACTDSGMVCCAESVVNAPDDRGCVVPTTLVPDEQACGCSEECVSTYCSPNINNPESMVCCPEGLTWNGADCIDLVKLRVAFIPVNWGSGMGAFDAAVEEQMAEIVNNIPLSECPERTQAVPIHTSCDFGFGCADGALCGHLNKMVQCANSAGVTDYDYLIGLEDSDVCGSMAGYSCGTGTVFSETESKIVSVHELGHEWGLNDEYVDACRCGPVVDPNANCLSEALDGDAAVPGFTSAYCGGGNRCAGYQVTCFGNRNPRGGRDIMSFANAPEPRGFAKESNDYVNSLPFLSCED